MYYRRPRANIWAGGVLGFPPVYVLREALASVASKMGRCILRRVIASAVSRNSSINLVIGVFQ